jgi:Domain of unknown function (DUF4178)
VEFRSAQSTHAVCGYCHSTVVRQGEVLARIGKMAEVFDDYSPLQLFAAGRWVNPQAQGQRSGFTVIGRLQFKTGSGTWSDWQVMLDDGRLASLSEDNGTFVFSTLLPIPPKVPDAAHLRLGQTTAINGVPSTEIFTVTANEPAALIAAVGELPKLPPLGQPFDLVELRNAQGEVLSIDYSSQPPTLSLGWAVLLDDLQLVGLRATSTQTRTGQQFNCPCCGSPISVTLATSQSITCGHCNSLMDLRQGIGQALQHAVQTEPIQPLIPLGSTGQLQGAAWQVVGFQHRMGVAAGDDEHFGWCEYLLYNQKRGFSFLVDAEDGWSQVKPTTGAPNMASNGQSATYLGTRYLLTSAYSAETSYVAGEFYWPVERGQKTVNREFANGKNRLSLEQTAAELTWSSGSMIDSALVAKAFQLEGKAALLQRGDVAPAAALTARGLFIFIVICVIIAMLLAAMNNNTCDPNREDCRSSSSGSGYRSSGGAYGGFSGGGGHK